MLKPKWIELIIINIKHILNHPSNQLIKKDPDCSCPRARWYISFINNSAEYVQFYPLSRVTHIPEVTNIFTHFQGKSHEAFPKTPNKLVATRF